MNPETLVCINIPNPDYTLYDRKYNPQALQEIDQPVFIDRLANAVARAGLSIELFETYSVWVRKDYQFLIIKKKTEFTEFFYKRSGIFFKKSKPG
jgi:hypothetical protein